MTFSIRQLSAVLFVVGLAFLLGWVVRDAATYLLAVGFAGAAGVLFGGSGQSAKGLSELPDAITRAQRGDRPALPAGAPPELAKAYDQIRELADQMREEQEARESMEEMVNGLESALRDASDGRRPEAPSSSSPEMRRVFEQAGRLADALQRAREAESTRLPAVRNATNSVRDHLGRLDESASRRSRLFSETGDAIKELAVSINSIGQHVEILTTSAEDSSSSILAMTSTNDEVVESIVDLASSVRETASSIEEMAYSIREVAKNVDALSLTAEETSSSMNEMDISIDQVQSNANETARLSEEVAQDAERGAEAILKTIGEIYRIKESTQEAVSVISNLGSRIEQIGQILNVIDDVAEQTNLLALNAAIIAAQAGEHGKGFAVVADEIKDLAERSGASTKEIAELTKTIQSESKNAIAAVERGAKNVDRGVEVSNDAERALKKILESSQKSTNMVRAIARATVEQAKGSKQVTDAIGRIAETVQQIAAATGQQARGSELIMKSAEKMRSITQNVERSSQDQARGGRQVSQAIESISNMVAQLNQAHRTLLRSNDILASSMSRFDGLLREDQALLVEIKSALQRTQELTA